MDLIEIQGHNNCKSGLYPCAATPPSQGYKKIAHLDPARFSNLWRPRAGASVPKWLISTRLILFLIWEEEIWTFAFERIYLQKETTLNSGNKGMTELGDQWGWKDCQLCSLYRNVVWRKNKSFEKTLLKRRTFFVVIPAWQLIVNQADPGHRLILVRLLLEALKITQREKLRIKRKQVRTLELRIRLQIDNNRTSWTNRPKRTILKSNPRELDHTNIK